MLENAKDQRKRDLIDKLDQQIDQVYQLMNKLLVDIDFDKIKPASKLKSMYRRLLVLKNSMKPGESQDRVSELIAIIQRYLHCEEPEEPKEK